VADDDKEFPPAKVELSEILLINFLVTWQTTTSTTATTTRQMTTNQARHDNGYDALGNSFFPFFN
jgi:hypothetical protein